MKTISIELSKKLNKVGLLDNIETEYVIELGSLKIKETNYAINPLDDFGNSGFIKTLTLEEAIELILKNKIYILFQYDNDNEVYCLVVYNKNKYFVSHKQIICIETMLEYLLDNNLLGKQRKSKTRITRDSKILITNKTKGDILN